MTESPDAAAVTEAAQAGVRTRRVLPVFLGLALSLVGVGVYLTGSAQPEAAAAVVAGNRPVNRGATDADDHTANNSPALARDPRHPERLAVVNRIDSPAYSCALHVSADGGATWRERAIPFPAGEEEPRRCFAPDVGFGADGTLYITFVTLKGDGNVPNAAWIVSAPQGRGALSTPVRITGPLAFQVRLLVAPGSSDDLRVTWVQAEEVALYAFAATDNPIVTASSDDGGATWTRPVRVSPASRTRVVAPMPAAGGGAVFVAYLDLGDDRLDYHGAHQGRGGPAFDGTWTLVVARSSDGRRWEETVVDAGIVPVERFIVFLPPLPSVVYDARNRRLHVAVQDARSGDADVRLWTSRDGARSFGQPVRVNDDRGAATSQYRPQLAVAPGGRLDVAYLDRRADPGDRRTGVSLQSSWDGGRTFRPSLRVSDVAFNSRIGLGQQNGLPDQGNRLGLVSTDRRALAVWTDTRSAVARLQEQDLASAVIAVSAGSAWGGRLHALGAALAVAGGLAAAAVILGQRRSTTGGRRQEQAQSESVAERW